MSKIRKVINSLDNSKEKAGEIRENLKIIMDLAESKAQIFEQDIQLDLKTGKTTDDLTVPITKVIGKTIEYRATASDKVSDVLGEVTSAIGGMISSGSAQGVINGIAKIATSALTTIMGVAEGEEQVVKLYSVVTDYPAIVRFDFAFWSRKIAAQSLKKYCETALACVAYKSAVDVRKLAFNDFLALYGPVLNAGFGSDQSKMVEMINQAKSVYGMYAGDDTNKSLAIVRSNVRPRGIALEAARKSTRGNF